MFKMEEIALYVKSIVVMLHILLYITYTIFNGLQNRT